MYMTDSVYNRKVRNHNRLDREKFPEKLPSENREPLGQRHSLTGVTSTAKPRLTQRIVVSIESLSQNAFKPIFRREGNDQSQISDRHCIARPTVRHILHSRHRYDRKRKLHPEMNLNHFDRQVTHEGTIQEKDSSQKRIRDEEVPIIKSSAVLSQIIAEDLKFPFQKMTNCQRVLRIS
jgi:hypothetical protein